MPWANRARTSNRCRANRTRMSAPQSCGLELFDDRHVELLPAPLLGAFVGGEEHVELVAFDGAAAVEDFHFLPAVVAGDREAGAEVEDGGVGGDEAAAVVG